MRIAGRGQSGTIAALALLLGATAALGQAESPPGGHGGDIVVTGQRSAKELGADVAPILHLDADAMHAMAATSIADLLKRLGARAQSPDGSDPIIAIDGRRPLGQDEYQALPFEAYQSTDVLPPEAAVKLGFPPTRTVVNLVTKARFRSVDASVGDDMATDGGTATGQGRVGLTRLHDRHRLTITGTASLQGALRQDRRSILPDPRIPFDAIGNVTAPDGGEIDPALSARAGRPVTIAAVPADPAARGTLGGYAATAGQPRLTDLGPYRDLRPQDRTYKLSAFLTRPVGTRTAASLTASIEQERSRALQGPATAAIAVPAGNPASPFERDVLLDRDLTEVPPLRQRGTSLTLHAGAGLVGSVAGWGWTLQASIDRKRSQSISDFGIDTSGIAAAVAAGADPFNGFTPAQLGGRLVDRSRSTITTSDAQLVVDGQPLRLPAGPVSMTATLGAQRAATDTVSHSLVDSSLSLGRTQGGGLVAATLPLASRADHVLPFLGRLSADLSAGVTGVSRYGALLATSYGATWTPVKRIQLVATIKDAAAAPALDRLASPTVITPNTPFFDLVTGQSLTVTALSGGNPDLRRERRHGTTLSANIQPFRNDAFHLTFSYETLSIRDQISFLSTVTPAIEAAFPDRFVRDATGRLTSIDFRPINFERERQRTLKGTASFSGAVGRKPPGIKDGPQTGVPFFSLSVTPKLRLEDKLLLRDGLPVLDLLRGDVITGTGSPPRWDVQEDMNIFYKGTGLYVQPIWHQGSRARSDQAEADLRFSGLTTIAMFAYIDLGEAFKKVRWAKNLSLNAGVQNLLNDRPRVRDRNGITPNSDQPDYLDPLGRVFNIGVHKLF